MAFDRAKLVEFDKQTAEANPEAVFKMIVDQYGEPGFRNKYGVVSQINERFWAELLAAEMIIVHERDEESFYIYNPANGLFEKQTIHLLKSRLSNRIQQAEREWDQYKGIARCDVEHNRSSVLSLLRGVVDKQDFFENRPSAIHTQNCMIVFEGGQPIEQPFSPSFCSRNQISVAYDPTADCPRFKKELIEPAMGHDDIELLQRMFGLVAIGVNRPQRIFILEGIPNTGKTTVGLIAQHLIGKRNCVELRPDMLNERFEMARAVGKTLYFGPDVDSRFLQSKGAHRLKSIVGGDPMDAERKNSNDHFPLAGVLNVLITSNSRLIVRLQGDYGAWQRRLVIIDYNGKPPGKRIEGFDKVLIEEEGSGILNWAILGLTKYEADCAEGGDLRLSDAQTNRVTALLSESDGLRNFVQTELQDGSREGLTGEEILSEYAAYAKDRGWQVVSIKNARSQLQDLMQEVWGKTSSHDLERGEKTLRGYRGVCFRKNGDEET
jgi:putative DNA primase/helicase